MPVDKPVSIFKPARFRLGEWLLMRPQARSFGYSQYGADGWSSVEPTALPGSSRFSRHVLLLPDHQCAFRNRSFPFELVSSGDIEEAVALDLEQWNPFQLPCGSLYFAQRDDDCWQVAVWVWPERLVDDYLALLPAELICTHVMPELAWSSACLRHASPVFLIQSSSQGQFYALVSPVGVPLAMAEVEGEAEARRFCRNFYDRVDETSIFVAGHARPYWLPGGAEHGVEGLPRAELLTHARLPGVMDWTDPVAWKRPVLAVLMTALVWMMADAAVLSLRAQSVDAMLVEARGAASQVLDDRDRVASMHEHLSRIHAFQRQQLMPDKLLARLTDAIPREIWLDRIQINGQWADLTGKGKEVARLAVLLEAVEGVEQVMLLGAVRPDARTGMELFHLRVMLADGDGR